VRVEIYRSRSKRENPSEPLSARVNADELAASFPRTTELRKTETESHLPASRHRDPSRNINFGDIVVVVVRTESVWTSRALSAPLYVHHHSFPLHRRTFTFRIVLPPFRWISGKRQEQSVSCLSGKTWEKASPANSLSLSLSLSPPLSLCLFLAGNLTVKIITRALLVRYNVAIIINNVPE